MSSLLIRRSLRPPSGEGAAWELALAVPRSWSCTQQVLAEPVERMGVRSSQHGHYTDAPLSPGHPQGWAGSGQSRLTHSISFFNSQMLWPPWLMPGSPSEKPASPEVMSGTAFSAKGLRKEHQISILGPSVLLHQDSWCPLPRGSPTAPLLFFRGHFKQ